MYLMREERAAAGLNMCSVLLLSVPWVSQSLWMESKCGIRMIWIAVSFNWSFYFCHCVICSL